MMRSTDNSLIFLFAGVLFWTGCNRGEEPILVNRIPKDRSGLEAFREPVAAPGMPANPDADQSPTRMVVAMYEQPDETWFFKVTGPPGDVESRYGTVIDFFDSVTFGGGKPTWTLPESWSSGESRPMRFATLVIDATVEPPLEMAISSLSAGQDRLLNVNRWRRQIGLPPAEPSQLEDLLKPVTAEPDYLLFDQTGTGSGGMSRPPFAGNRPAPPVSPSNENSGGVEFTVPEGWESGPRSAIVQARLQKNIDQQRLEITLIRMPADLNEWQPNVVRWAGQVGVEIAEGEVDQQTRSLSVDGLDGQQIELFSDDREQGIIAGMIKSGPHAWFLKLSGPGALVEQHRDVFEQFADSIHF